MATPLDLPLPEITTVEFHQAWTRFELVANAKEWNTDRRKVVLPTLLRGKLVEYYMEADEATRGDLAELKTFLMTKVGLVRDPLTSSQLFMSRSQHPGERILDFVADLKKLFKEAYSTEDLTSTILLQRFLTGLLPPIRRQLLLRGTPNTLVQAVKDAADIEYALNFAGEVDNTQDVNVIRHKPSTQESFGQNKLQESLDQIIKRLEALETVQKQSSLPPTEHADGSHRNQPSHGRRQQGRQHGYAEPTCWLCGELGHIKRYCPLNFNRPARRVGSWPQP